MANFRTTADILDSVLSKSGEVTNGNSPYESRALEYLNRIYHAIISGGTEFNMEVDEPWVWAKNPSPIVIELQPKYNTGSLTLTNGSAAGTFSSAPASSLQGWFIKVNSRAGVFKIATHTAGATSFTLDGSYDGTTGSSLNFEAFKLDYELVPSHIVIDNTNNKIDFEETASTELTATLTSGTYTPSALATEVKTQLDSAGASTYTVTYSSTTKKFTLASNLGGGGGTFKLLAQSGTNQSVSALIPLGFDIEDKATAASHTSTYILGGISRLIEPVVIYKGYREQGSERQEDYIGILDPNTFTRNYSIGHSSEHYPTKACIIKETSEGAITLRFNHYPSETTRIEIPYIPVPIDLKDNAQSIPIFPRKYLNILEDGATAVLLFEKEDSKWEGYQQKAAAGLQAMTNQNRNMLQRIGKNFAQTIAREDMVARTSRRLIYGTQENS